jgi:hypothetical protein
MEEALSVYADEEVWHESDRNCDFSIFIPQDLKYHSNIYYFKGWDIAKKALRGES